MLKKDIVLYLKYNNKFLKLDFIKRTCKRVNWSILYGYNT